MLPRLTTYAMLLQFCEPSHFHNQPIPFLTACFFFGRLSLIPSSPPFTHSNWIPIAPFADSSWFSSTTFPISPSRRSSVMTLLENQRRADTDVVNSGVNDDDPIVGGEVDHEHSGVSVGMSGKLDRMDACGCCWPHACTWS